MLRNENTSWQVIIYQYNDWSQLTCFINELISSSGAERVNIFFMEFSIVEERISRSSN
ncbi:unnamed protein product [Schistosoma margrebowiei]|uniref:Uncharacterized protein n=1 Tax=Schistosoma margrebowiei TaxID=48269 RepID=A0A183M9G2_9TREM|nr:unnamed protein product [Schistosoma margrebowiei]